MEWISIKDKLPTRENGYDWVLVMISKIKTRTIELLTNIGFY